MSMRSSLLAILLAMALPLVAGDPVREWRYKLARASGGNRRRESVRYSHRRSTR